MRRDEYLEDIRSKALEAIAENPLLRLASRVKARAFVDSILVKAKNYCDEVEAVYLEQDWKHCRKDEKKNLNQHLEWTVEFQVHAKPFAQIARESTRVVTAKAVAKAVREMLSLILLKERLGVKRGRPKGSRTIYHAHNPSK